MNVDHSPGKVVWNLDELKKSSHYNEVRGLLPTEVKNFSAPFGHRLAG